jgi:hypothetical protein
LEQRCPVVVVGLLVDRPAVGLREDQVVVMPFGAGQHLLAELSGLLLVQRGDQRHRKGKGALAAPGLGLLVDQPAADAVDAAPHGEGVGQQVDVLPLQRERPGLAQAEREGDGPPGFVPGASGRLEDGACLVEVQGGGEAALLLRWWVDERGDIARDVAALDRDGQGPGQDAVVPENGSGE